MQEYIDKHRNTQIYLLDFIDIIDASIINDHPIFSIIQNLILDGDKLEITSFITLIINISNYKHRRHYFFDHIDQILLLLKDKIMQLYSNLEIFNLFKNNNRILHFIIVNHFLIQDDLIDTILSTDKNHYEFERIFKMTEFDNGLKSGENQREICQIIRKDSIQEFTILKNLSDINLSDYKINSTFDETNKFLLKKKKVSLIEYATFFGSLKIIQYLVHNKVELNSSLWFFAIYSNNAKVIRYLEEKGIFPDNSMAKDLYYESIKSFDTQMTDYIRNNYFNESDSKISFQDYCCCFKCHNYVFFPERIDNNSAFCALCKYNLNGLARLLLNNSKFDINQKVVVEKTKIQYYNV